MSTALEELELVLEHDERDVRRVYDRVASRYDNFRELWLQLAGGQAEERMREYLSLILKPGQRVLDAGAGTGAMTRQMLEIEPAIRPTLLDLSPAMLALAKDLPGEHIEGSVMDVPFEKETFDVVVSAWVIETVPNPIRAVSEYLRVVSRTGFVLCTFCSEPDRGLAGPGSELLRVAVGKGFAGRFLKREEAPWSACEHSRRVEFRNGLTTLIVLRKCCKLGSCLVPIPKDDFPPTPF